MGSKKRRDAGRPRGAPIADAVIKATIEELVKYGVHGISINRIAAAAEVNKTTIYRKWPTREDLIDAALVSALEETTSELEDRGSLKADLTFIVEQLVEKLSTPSGQALIAASLSRGAADRSAGASTAPYAPNEILALLQRAQERGEWDLDRHPPDAVFSMISGAVIQRIMIEYRPVTPSWVASVVEVVIRGVSPE
ncbi:MAG: TetR/AcrR family transcriptional regulator [Myxococcota bacterium]